MRLLPPSAHARPIDGRSGPFARPSACRPCRLGRRHLSALATEFVVGTHHLGGVIFATIPFPARRPPPSCRSEVQDTQAGAIPLCLSTPRTSPRLPTTA